MIHGWIIGFSPSCDIQVHSSFVSSRHCRIIFDGQTWTLEDLGSTNGTFVNGKKITGLVSVLQTDQITLGLSEPMPWPHVGRSAQSKGLYLSEPGAVAIIGRLTECDVVLDFPMISARHASVKRTSSGWLVQDLGSTNGTFVRGQRITGAVSVDVGEAIGLGSYQLVLSADGDGFFENDRRGDAVVEARGVMVDVPGKRLISDISMVVKPGEFVGIMGPSGAGKSILLSSLVGERQPSQGQVAISNVDLYARFEEFRGQIGYVPQDDIMHSDLTVFQALLYSARLRLPRDFSNDEIKKRIARVISQLGLQGTEHVRIGSAERRGISGGQRKRVNIAMELLTDPPIVILDEPTSGLSSMDALSLMTLLRDLVKSGKTIIVTIHQPSLEVYKLLDGLAVIGRDASSENCGRLVWYGPAYPDAINFFEPTVVAGKTRDADAVLRGLSQRSVASWIEAYENSQAHIQWQVQRSRDVSKASEIQKRKPVSLIDALTQLWVLVQRTYAVKFADFWSLGILLFQAPVIAILVAAVFGGKTNVKIEASSWAEFSTSLATIAFLMALAAIWFGCSNAAREIVSERAIYRRERMVGLSLYAYLASKVFVLSSICVVQCSLFLMIVGSGCGFQGDMAVLFKVIFFAACVGVMIGLVVSSLANSAETAAGILPIVILPMIILGGILLPLSKMPSAMTVLADVMPSRWAFEGILVEEAQSRSLLENIDIDPTLKDERPKPVYEDIAERWFPEEDWRTSKSTPTWMLLTLWLLGLFTVRTVLVHREKQ